MRIVLILHLIFWIFFAITVALNNRSLKDMKDNKYYFLIKINKIILLSLVCITILISVYWTIIYKNFEFYCEAFQRQLKDNSDAMNANIEQSENISIKVRVNNIRIKRIRKMKKITVPPRQKLLLFLFIQIFFAFILLYINTSVAEPYMVSDLLT